MAENGKVIDPIQQSDEVADDEDFVPILPSFSHRSTFETAANSSLASTFSVDSNSSIVHTPASTSTFSPYHPSGVQREEVVISRDTVKDALLNSMFSRMNMLQTENDDLRGQLIRAKAESGNLQRMVAQGCRAEIQPLISQNNLQLTSISKKVAALTEEQSKLSQQIGALSKSMTSFNDIRLAYEDLNRKVEDLNLGKATPRLEIKVDSSTRACGTNRGKKRSLEMTFGDDSEKAESIEPSSNLVKRNGRVQAAATTVAMELTNQGRPISGLDSPLRTRSSRKNASPKKMTTETSTPCEATIIHRTPGKLKVLRRLLHRLN